MHTTADKPFELAVLGMTKKFGATTLWSDISFTVQAGTLCAVTGPSGSGKTTLLNCIGLLEEFNEGTLRLGTSIFTAGSKLTSRIYFRDILGFVFQNSGLVESWNVRENLMIPLSISHGSRSNQGCAIDEALERVGMRGTEKAKIFTLSGGEQQRVALARLILKRPTLILADEPTSSLDSANAEMVLEILTEQAEHGALVVISTHSDDIVRRCSEVIRL